MDHGWVMRSFVDWWRCGPEDARARWRAHWSLASGDSRAQEFIGEGTKERGECGEPVLGLTKSWVVVCWPSDSDEATTEGGLSGGGV
jgi:hypothetical protein